jgi:hypothetical protein
MLLLFLEALFGETDFPLFFTFRFDYLFSHIDALHGGRKETIHWFNQ